MRALFLNLVLAVSVMGCFELLANDTPTSKSLPETELNKTRVSLDGFFGSLQVDPHSLTGAGLQIGVNSGISDNWGLGLMVGRAWTYSSTTLFTQVSLEARRSLISRPLSDSSSAEPAGLMLHAFIHRIVVSTSSSDLGYFGLGSAISYELPISEKDSFRLGGRADYSFKSDFSFFSFQLFSGLIHRF